MTRKGEAITLSVSLAAKQGLEAIAQELGYTWGNKPNISKLIEAIGVGDVTVINKTDANRKLQSLAETPEVKEFLALLKKIEK